MHVLKRYKLATVTNLLGLSLAFFLFMLICIHVNHEYGFDSSIAGKERIFQIERLRDNGAWDTSFPRPQLEHFIAASPNVEKAAITNNLAYTSFRFGVSTGSGPDTLSYMEYLERITPGFVEVFGFEMLNGNADCMKQPGNMLIPESVAGKLFGTENPLGKPVYLSEFKGIDSFYAYEQNISSTYTVGGVYRDFPENTRVRNALYVPISEKEMMENWHTGGYFGYLLMPSEAAASATVAQYIEENRELLKNLRVDDIRLRPLTELYFGEHIQSDAIPKGNKLRTNMLLFIAVLIIGIALVNYINLSVALAPVRIKSITIQKVLGSQDTTLRKYLVLESSGISIFAFFIALCFVFISQNIQWVADILGHPLDLASNWMILVWTFILVTGCGILAGVYPAFYITSFPPATALNGSFSLSSRAKSTRELLIGFQFVISITLIIGSLFVFLQNKYIGTTDLGFDKDNILEIRLSMGMAQTKSDLFRNRLLEHPDIKDVAFSEYRFVSDESRPHIGYNYREHHSYMDWFGISSNFPDVMDVKMIAGRSFRPSDEAPDNKQAVCILNETAAQKIISRFPLEEFNDISDLIGTSISDDDVEVQIVGIFRDLHYESLYREVQPQGFWVSARNYYRNVMLGNYSYVKIAGGNPKAAIEHIRATIDELNPGYPADIRFFDKTLDELYSNSHRQGVLVTALCLLAVILSLVGVFGLVIFESQGREKEIAVRKVFGATVRQILWLFNSSFLQVVLICFILAVPIAYYGVSIWLQSFAYKTQLHLWVFLIALAVITILTVLTVTFQSYRAATANPAPKLYR